MKPGFGPPFFLLFTDLTRAGNRAGPPEQNPERVPEMRS